MTKEEQIRKMYEGNLNSQKATLQEGYETAVSNLDAQKAENQKVTDANLNKTASDANRRAMNDAEYYAASGLTSGAKAQARMARDNQVASDISAIRAAQQLADADIERQRGLLAKEYDSAIRKAQADNDMAMAKALYKQAQADEESLLAQQKAASERELESAKLLADESGDYTRLGQLYGWTPEEIAYMNALYKKEDGTVEGLGYGDLTAEKLDELIMSGYVELYVQGDTIKFRKTPKAKQGANNHVIKE